MMNYVTHISPKPRIASLIEDGAKETIYTKLLREVPPQDYEDTYATFHRHLCQQEGRVRSLPPKSREGWGRRSDMGTISERVRQAIGDGEATASEISERIGVGLSTVSDYATRLMGDGLIERVSGVGSRDHPFKYCWIGGE